MAGVSVIICCYNSATRIAETLQSIARQNLDAAIACEVILVDNASKDNTAAVASDTWTNYGTPSIDFKVIQEPRPGLSYARESGMKASKHDTILFCDDDNHLFPNYIQEGMTILKDMPEVGIVGGYPLPKLAYYPGKWIEDMYPAMAIGSRASSDGYTDWVFGAGMLVRKKIYKDLKSKSISLLLSDRVGQKQTSGGDSELCFLAIFLGYKIYYCSNMRLFHEMQEHRLKKSFFIKGNYKNVYSLVYLYLLSCLVNKGDNVQIGKLYISFLMSRIKNVFYSLPRLILGKHQFFNFIILYQSLQVIYWLAFRKALFFQTAEKIKVNLSL